MKKLFAVILLSVIVLSCHHKMTPAKSVDTAPAVVAPPTVTVDSATAANATAANNPTIVAAGKMVYEAKCAKCHGLKDPANYTQARWIGLVNSMAPRAKATDDEKVQILAYVQHNAKDAVKN